jgi:hypothetical protein
VLTLEQKAKLRSVARTPSNPDLGKENAKLIAALSELELENPQAFLTKNDLPLRRFFHKPDSNVPFLTFVRERL